MSINLKTRTKKTKELNAEINDLLSSLKNIKKQRYSFWFTAVGETISKVAVPVYKKNGILLVKVQDSVWRFELTRRKDELLESINKELKENKKIKDIIFK